MSAPSPLPIRVHLTRSTPQIFSHADAFYTRRHLRLLGDFVGTLPKHTSQNQYLALPLSLSYDEAAFGLARGFFRFHAHTPSVYPTHTPADAAAFFACRAADEHHQADETVRHQLLERDKHLAKGAKRRRSTEHTTRPPSPFSDDAAYQQPPSKAPRTTFLSRIRTSLRFFLGGAIPSPTPLPPSPSTSPSSPPSQPLTSPPTSPSQAELDDAKRQQALEARLRHQALSTALVITSTTARDDERAGYTGPECELRPPRGVRAERLAGRAAVFADLHDRGYYLSCGAKFGADFLAYAGDPQLYHAALAVVVVGAGDEVSPLEVVALGRLGDSTKKRTVLAYKEGDAVCYVGVQWEETLP